MSVSSAEIVSLEADAVLRVGLVALVPRARPVKNRTAAVAIMTMSRIVIIVYLFFGNLIFFIRTDMPMVEYGIKNSHC